MADPKIRLKRSSVEGKIPTSDQVPLGEIALNTYDGYLYASKNIGIGTTVIAINPFRVGTGTNTYNAYFTAGNVGIGSEIPTTKLDVDGTVTATSFAGSGSNLTGLTGASANTYGGSGATPVITVDSGGRITGISTVAISGGGGGGSALTVKEVASQGGATNVTVSNVSEIQFNNGSGFNVSDEGSGTAFIDLGSTFNPWYVNGEDTLSAAGEEPIEFIAGPGIAITTKAVASVGIGTTFSKAITFTSTGISDIVGDTTPQLGGNLDLNSKDITGTGNVNVTGIITATALAGFDYLQAPHGTTVNYSVTVDTKTAAHRYNGTGSGNGYLIDGVESPFLTLTPGRTYRFTLSSSDMSSHPFRFYLEADKTTAYTTNVTSTATYTEIVVTDTTPTVLHYQCAAHGYMGNAVQVNSNKVNTPYQIDGLKGASIVGATTATSFVKSGGTSSQFLKADGSVDSNTYLTSYTETDPVVAAINGIVKSNGTTISAATAGTDYLTPSGDGSGLTGLTGASANTYGSSGATPVIVVDSDGRITGISTVAISGGGGGGISNVVEDTTPQLGGNLDLNSKDITGTGRINISGIATATSFVKSGGTSSQFLKADGSVDSSTYLTSSGDGSGLTGLTGASAATYGSAGATPVIVVDSDGRITGISTVAISGGGGGGTTQNLFETIAVSGQNDVVADSATDTLTFIAGSNMTITTNSSGDSITFASSGGGGGGGSTNRLVNRYVATQSQTLFPASGSISYSVGYLDAYLNGSKLDTTEFTASNGTTVTLTTGASANDVVELVAFTSVNLTDVTVVNDITPQLGGDLDLNNNNITGTGNINITGTATVTGGQVATQNDAIAFAIALG